MNRSFKIVLATLLISLFGLIVVSVLFPSLYLFGGMEPVAHQPVPHPTKPVKPGQ